MNAHDLAAQPFKINIAIPSHESCHMLFAYDLAQLVALTMGIMPADEGHSLGISSDIGTYVHVARTELLQHSIETEATHVLWLDSDMRFPADALIRLLKHQVSVVGVNYSKRRIPAEFVAVERFPTEGNIGSFLYTGPESTGLAEVQAIGFGCVLMETAALKNLPDPKKEPWFWYERLPDGKMVGEDVYFCRLIKRLFGTRLFVDQDLSWQCEHMGSFGFKCAHAADEWNEILKKQEAHGPGN